MILIDEINMAEDSVLERLNSVLESERKLLITELNTEIQGFGKFSIIATMNPGGDFGKKELSPALRNRFTEIWVEPITSANNIAYSQFQIKTMLYQILNHRFLQLFTNHTDSHSIVDSLA